MTLDTLDFIQEAVSLNLPAITYIVTFYDVRRYYEITQKDKSPEWYDLQSAVLIRKHIEKGGMIKYD